MHFWTAFLLGLAGSLHCAGMCGPLALALPGRDQGRNRFVLGRVCNTCGRLTTYALLGAIFGGIGGLFDLAGLQRWMSMLAGVAILVGLVFSSRMAAGVPVTQAVTWIKSRLAGLFRNPSPSSLFVFGMINGLLPCGLVYAACAAATTAGSVAGGAAAMTAFGLGTVPLMLTIGLAGRPIQHALRFKLQRLVPASLLLVGLLLVLRGMALGIPYLSPDLSGGGSSCCHPGAEVSSR